MEWSDLTKEEIDKHFSSLYDKYYLLINKKNYRESGKHFISGASVDPTHLIHKMRINGSEQYQLVAPYRKVKGDI